MAKSVAVQRKSERVIVPMKPTTNNGGRGKDPCSGNGGSAGKREGVPERANNPASIELDDKVRQLQLRLWAAAKQHLGRRFHALYDHLSRSDVLDEAWNRVKGNKGSAGVDRLTIAEIERRGVISFLDEIATSLRAGTYEPALVLRRYIPKADGKKRPLGIPTVRDRVVQMAAKLVMEPVFEADFRPCSFGFRPKRNATQALEVLRERAAQGGNHVLDADIKDYFGSIDHEKLMLLVGRRVSDSRMLKLIRMWLEAGVMDEGVVKATDRGTPQGGVISPLLSNIYLHVLDEIWEKNCSFLGELVRYADDFVIMCKSKTACGEAERRVKHVLGRLGLELHPEKTRRVDLSWGKDGFDFLGCHLRKRFSGAIWKRKGKRLYFLHRWPSLRAMKRIRQRVKQLTGRHRFGVKDVRVIIRALNPVLRGWANYFRSGNAASKFSLIEDYVWRCLFRFMKGRKNGRLKPDEAMRWTSTFFHDLGLYNLNGSIRYPGAVHASA